MIVTLTVTERCDLLALDGKLIATDVTVRWFHFGKQGQIEYSCKELFSHVEEPVEFVLRFHVDNKKQQVLSSSCALDLRERIVPFVVSGNRE
jgi:hypothetical protein